MRLNELYESNQQVEMILNTALHMVNEGQLERAADELQVRGLRAC